VALKNLVAEHTNTAEETIEKIVAPHVRYDAAAHKIVWTLRGRWLGHHWRYCSCYCTLKRMDRVLIVDSRDRIHI
jgi:hypothetical protein